MAFFGLVFLLIVLAAAGLAVGLLRGRPLLPGSCGEGRLTGGLLPRCVACIGSRDGTPDATEASEGSIHGDRA